MSEQPSDLGGPASCRPGAFVASSPGGARDSSACELSGLAAADLKQELHSLLSSTTRSSGIDFFRPTFWK